MGVGITKAQSKKHGDARNIRGMPPECTIAGDAVLRSSLPNVSGTLPECTLHRI